MVKSTQDGRPRWRSLLVTSQASSSATTYKLYFMLREDQRLSTKGRTFRNTATYQKLRGGVPSTPSPCTTVGVWICLYVRLLINPNQNFMDFPYYRSIRKCEKRFVKLFACKTTVLENSFSIKAELSCETKTCRLVTAELRLNVSVNEKEPIPLLARQICEFTQQDYYLRVLWWSSLKLISSAWSFEKRPV